MIVFIIGILFGLSPALQQGAEAQSSSMRAALDGADRQIQEPLRSPLRTNCISAWYMMMIAR